MWTSLSAIVVIALLVGRADGAPETECKVDSDGTQVCADGDAATKAKAALPADQAIIIGGELITEDTAEFEKLKAETMKKREARREKAALMKEIRASVEDDADLVASAESSPSSSAEKEKETPKVDEKTSKGPFGSRKKTVPSPSGSADESEELSEAPKEVTDKTNVPSPSDASDSASTATEVDDKAKVSSGGSDESEDPEVDKKATGSDGSFQKPKDIGPSPVTDSKQKKAGIGGDGADGGKKSGGGKGDPDFWARFKEDNPQLVFKKMNINDVAKRHVTPPPAEQKLMMETPYEEGGLLVSNPTTGRSVILRKQQNDGNEVEKEGTIKVLKDMVTYLQDVVLAKEEYADMYNKCTNTNELCAFWAYMGECYMNEDFMIRDQFCLLACKKCEKHKDYSSS